MPWIIFGEVGFSLESFFLHMRFEDAFIRGWGVGGQGAYFGLGLDFSRVIETSSLIFGLAGKESTCGEARVGFVNGVSRYCILFMLLMILVREMATL